MRERFGNATRVKIEGEALVHVDVQADVDGEGGIDPAESFHASVVRDLLR